MRPTLAAKASVQGGLVTRRQAVEAGYSERELRSLTAVHGPWVVVRRGVYVEREQWESLDPYDGQWLVRDRAAHLTMTRQHLLSHDSAARMHGLPLLRPRVPLVHLTRPGVQGSRTEHGVRHHLTRRPLEEQSQVSGIPVTGLAWTALDIGREHGHAAGQVAVDAVLRRGVLPRRLGDDLETMRYWPGITRARAAVELGDGGAESPGESLARLLVIELGLCPDRPETQFPVPVGDSVAWCDLRLGRHVFEFDGRLKYRRQAQGGVAAGPVEEVLWEEKNRQRLICALGLGISRIIWDDLWGAARKRAVARLRAEYQVTLDRFGYDLPEHLEAFARQLRGRRRAA